MTAPNPLSPEMEAMVLRVAIDIANRVSPSEDGDERDPDNMMVLRVAQEEIKRTLSPHLQEMLAAERERCAKLADEEADTSKEMKLAARKDNDVAGAATHSAGEFVARVIASRIRSNP